jgi:hypothetical protein
VGATQDAQGRRSETGLLTAFRKRGLSPALALRAAFLVCLLLVGTAMLWGTGFNRYPSPGSSDAGSDAGLSDMAWPGRSPREARGAASSWWRDPPARPRCQVQRSRLSLGWLFRTQLSVNCEGNQLEVCARLVTRSDPP